MHPGLVCGSSGLRPFPIRLFGDGAPRAPGPSWGGVGPEVAPRFFTYLLGLARAAHALHGGGPRRPSGTGPEGALAPQ
eukprot:2365771-Pyramimonas_sp.AAC.1